MDVGQYLEIFIDESSEHLQTLSDCIMTLEQEPDNKDTINEVFRAAHSLKGMAGTMGFKRMQHLTHDMENVFQEVRSDKIQVDSAMIDLLFECLDALDGYLANVKNTSDEGTEDNENIIKELNDFLAKANGEAPKSSAPKKEESAPKKDDAPAASGGEDVHIPNLELTDKEIDDIKSAKDSGHKIYYIDVAIQKDCLLKAARAFLVFKADISSLFCVILFSNEVNLEDKIFISWLISGFWLAIFLHKSIKLFFSLLMAKSREGASSLFSVAISLERFLFLSESLLQFIISFSLLILLLLLIVF